MTYLNSLQGVTTSGQEVLRPIVEAYLQSVLLPSRQGQTSLRNLQELRTLAKALDLMLSGRQAEACDVLMQRFQAVECADQEGTWSTARHLELIGDTRVSSSNDRQRRLALQLEKSEVRYKKDLLTIQNAKR